MPDAIPSRAANVDVETAVRWYRKRSANASVERCVEVYENSLRRSREAKRRRRGICVDCGVETRYAGHGKNVSDRCVPCANRHNGEERRFTREEIIDALRVYYEETGEVPAVHLWQLGMRQPSHTVIFRMFGSWRAACEAAGFAARPQGFPSDAWKRRWAGVDTNPVGRSEDTLEPECA
jgi:hypothetical protein